MYIPANARKGIYIKVMSVHYYSLFNAIYDLNELGYKVYTDEHNNWYKLYVGPFKSVKKANKSLLVIKKYIAKDAHIINQPQTSQKRKRKVFYQKKKKKKKKKKTILSTVDSVEVGLQAYSYNNTFEKEGVYNYSLEGYKYGVSLTGTKTIGDLAYLIGDIRFTLSDIKYKDSLGDKQKSDESMYEIRIITGYEAIISPYIGIGYGHLYNDMREMGGSRHELVHMYMPIGVTYQFAVNKTARISTSIEYDSFLNGEVTINMSDNGPAYVEVYGNAPTYKLTDAYGIRVNTTYKEEIWSIGLFFNYTNIEKSEANYYLNNTYMDWVKANSTKELGLQIKYRF